MNLKDKVAVITGSTSGIGLTIAEGLAKAGANIMLNGFGDKDVIEALQGRLEKQYDVRVWYSGANMQVPAEIQALIQDTLQAFDRIDILVNNAGIQFVSPIEKFPEDKWDQILAINLTAAFHTIRSSLPYMRQQKWGRIINIASAHGLIGSPFKSAYVAAKHGLVGLTKVIALETATDSITCNAICPGYVHTPLVDKQIEEQAKSFNLPVEKVISEVLLKSQPNKKFVEPQAIADLVVFLCSQAGDGITGATLSVDGGWTAA